MRKTFILIPIFLLFCGCSKDSDNNIIEPSDDACAPTLSIAVRCEYTLLPCDSTLKTSVQCLGITAKKVRCKNTTKHACGFCTTHLEQNIDGRCPIMTNNACNFCDDHKSQIQ
ncbi:MAG: hypothetical protein LBO69_03620 [Ignavibacteria bacterium]|jgi:hypothetical protein|nr:hypothetical protein [Ignavibacteria bacterium]